jgi:hypothetical protein
MAASGWNFIVEFDGDRDKLLATLHADAWERRRFELPCGEPEFLDEIEFFTVDDEERNELADQYGLHPLLLVAERIGFDNFLPWYAERVQTGEVSTLEELRAMQCISSAGTHSPLDIFKVTEAPEDFGLCPMTSHQIVEVFGNPNVDRAAVAEMETMYVACKLPGAYRRWQAVFCPLHTDGMVTHAYIEGASGD